MSTLAFLIAPAREVPERTDPEWYACCCAWINGTFMAWFNLRMSLPEDRRPQRPWFDSPNLTVNAADYMALNRAEHRETYQRYVADQLATWEANGRPDIVIDYGPAEYCAMTGAPSQIGLDRLTGFRCLLQPIPATKLKRGGTHGLLANQGSLFHFDVDHELVLLQEITRAYGGDSLALWTFGHTVQLLLLRAQEGQQPRRYRWSIRLPRPAGQPRRAALLGEMRSAFEGSSLTPDWKEVERLLGAPLIDVGPWFDAFGLPGAAELTPKDGAAQWEALDTAGTSLLRNETPDAALVKRLNSTLVKVGKDKVPGKPGKGMARKLFGVAWQLRQAVGIPDEATRWKERYAAAESYDDIASSDALDRLTTGYDSKGMGASASLARLMAYYPATLYRDGWFWSLSAWATESANGHAFIAAMETLAQAAHSAGFTVVVFPSAKQEIFRKAFKIDRGQAEAEREWSAEAFVDLPGLLKMDVAQTAGAWLVKNKASGIVARCEADGHCRILAWKDGKPTDAEGDLTAAALALDPRAALQALGYNELLSPVEWRIAEVPDNQAVGKRIDLAQTEGWSSELPEVLPRTAGEVVMLVAVKTDDVAYVEQLTTDLIGGAKLKARREGSSVHSATSSSLHTADVAALMGDLPSGSVWAAANQAGRFRREIP